MMPPIVPPKATKTTTVTCRGLILGVLCFGVAFVLFIENSQTNDLRLVRSESKPVATTTRSSSSAGATAAKIYEITTENWRGAPVGDGEDTIDSYHSHDHRPPGNDPRDVLLKQFSVHPCPNNGVGTMVSGQDSRYFDLPSPANLAFKERNPKFLCDVHKLPDSPHQPCVVYSFGSWDEISFEVGIDEITQSKCDVHTFDPSKLPNEAIASKYNFKVHDMGISGSDNGKFKTLSTIMSELGHSHVHVLKIDIEGNERGVLPNLIEEGILSRVDQLSIEFHSVALMKEGLTLLEAAGFNIVFARREDRCVGCTEVTMVVF